MFELADCDADCFNCAVINLTEWEQDEIDGVTFIVGNQAMGEPVRRKALTQID